MKVALRHIPASAQKGCDVCAQVSIVADLAIEHLIRNVIHIHLRALLLQAIGNLRLDLDHQIGTLLQYLDDLVGGETGLRRLRVEAGTGTGGTIDAGIGILVK